MGKEELGDRAGMPRQQFSVGPTLHSMLNLLDDLRGGEISMPERRTGTDADRASNLGDLQSQVNLEQDRWGSPVKRANPRSCIWSRWKIRSSPMT